MDSRSSLSSTAAKAKGAGLILPSWLRGQLAQVDGAKLYSRWFAIFDFISKLALLAGIIFSVVQFLAFQKAEQVKYTFQFVEKFDTGSFLQARQAISDALRQHENKIAQLNATRMSPDAEAKIRARLAQFLVNDSNNGKGIARELDLVLRFFNGLQICLEKELCNREVADAFLLAYARSIQGNFRPYIEERRKIVRGYGLGLELFLKTSKAAT
jgi:hypothetical protein